MTHNFKFMFLILSYKTKKFQSQDRYLIRNNPLVPVNLKRAFNTNLNLIKVEFLNMILRLFTYINICLEQRQSYMNFIQGVIYDTEMLSTTCHEVRRHTQ